MKALLLLLFLLIVCVVLFVAGVISPRRSKRLQSAVDKLSKKGEDKSDRSAGRVGDATHNALEKARSAADASARSGRRVHDKITPD